MHRILCSTGALIGRPNLNNGDFTFLGKCVDRLECDGYEFMIYPQWYDRADELRSYLKSFPAPFPVFHCEKRLGDAISRNAPGDTESVAKRFEINARLASDIGAEKLVLHLWGGLDSDRHIAHNVDMYAKLRRISDEYGLCLCIENIVCNTGDPLTHLKELAAIYPDIEFTYDTKMAEFHDQLNDIFLAENLRLFTHVSHMHINDYRGGIKEWAKLRTLHMGKGQVDFDGFFRNLLQNGYSGDFTVEATSYNADGVIDFDALNDCFRRIREYIDAK